MEYLTNEQKVVCEARANDGYEILGMTQGSLSYNVVFG